MSKSHDMSRTRSDLVLFLSVVPNLFPTYWVIKNKSPYIFRSSISKRHNIHCSSQFSTHCLGAPSPPPSTALFWFLLPLGDHHFTEKKTYLNAWAKWRVYPTTWQMYGCVCYRSKLNSGEIFLTWVDSLFPLSPCPNS